MSLMYAYATFLADTHGLSDSDCDGLVCEACGRLLPCCLATNVSAKTV